MVEIGIGIIAGSAPSLRRLFLSCLGDQYESSRESKDRDGPRSQYQTRARGTLSIKLGNIGVRGHNKITFDGPSDMVDWTELTDSDGK